VTLFGEGASSTIPAESDKFQNVVVSVGYRNADSALTWVVLNSTNKRRINTLEYDVPSTVPAARSYAIRFTFDNSDETYISTIHGIGLTFNSPSNAKGND
jgi:hypothetical protein